MNRKLLITRTLTLLGILLFSLTGCNQVIDKHRDKLRSDAAEAEKNGNHVEALNLYESSLDATPESADVHLQMALICESKINDPLGALFHYRRCEHLDPKGKHASEAKKSYERLEPAVIDALSDGPSLSKKDAVVLKNENNALRQQVNELKEQLKAQAALARLRKNDPAAAEKAAAPSPEMIRKMGGKTYVVEPGDTFPSIAKKLYNSKARAQDIQDANINTVPDPKKLKIGQVLIIPR